MSIRLFGKSQILRKDEEICVIRQGTSIANNVVYVDGKPVKRKSQEIRFCIVANVQPLGARELLLVPEGDRFKEQYYLYFENRKVTTEEGIEITAENLVKDNDIIMRLGIKFQVQGTENWGTYSRARIMAVDVGPEKNNDRAQS